MSYYRKPRPVRNLTPEEQLLWVDAIRERTGTSLGRPSEVYAQRGLVYAGSEYVARLGATNHPDDATEWAESVHAIDYSRRQA